MILEVFRYWIDYSIEVRQRVKPTTYSPENKTIHDVLSR